MHISNLNVRITLQKNAVVIDKIGNHTNEWQDYYSCYATVSGETGTEQAIVGETVENRCFSASGHNRLEKGKNQDRRCNYPLWIWR